MQDELTLKELILTVQDYFRYFLRKWYWFVLGAVVMGGGFFYPAYTEPIVYSAPLTFVMNNEKDKGLGAGGIIGSLGLGGNGGGGSQMKLLEMAKSRQLLGKVLFDSVTVEGKSQFTADHLIERYDYHTLWEDSEEKTNFLFEGKRPSLDERAGNSVFKQLHSLLTRETDGVLVTSIDELSGVFTIQASTLHPELSIHITEGVYRELKDHFVEATINGKQQTLKELSHRADSVRQELNVAEARLARFEDRSGNITLRYNAAEGRRIQREVAILNSMYTEVVKNRETAAFLLNNERPAFSLIDGPLEPLQVVRESWISALVIGGSLGGLLVGISLFFYKLVGDAMRS